MSKYEEITPEFVKECTDSLEFYDKNGYLPWEGRIKRIWRKCCEWGEGK